MAAVHLQNLEFWNIEGGQMIFISNESSFMWEQFTDYANICGESAWLYLSEILRNEECCLFFNQIECRKAYLFKNGRDLCDVIGETYNCEVYVTDCQGTYIICFNHEMILTGCGRAKRWIDEKKKSQIKSKRLLSDLPGYLKGMDASFETMPGKKAIFVILDSDDEDCAKLKHNFVQMYQELGISIQVFFA